MPSVDSSATTHSRGADFEHRGAVLAALAQQSKNQAATLRARAIVDIVAGLTDDNDMLIGAMLFPLLEANALTAEQAAKTAGAAATRIASELLRLGSLQGSLSLAIPAGQSTSLSGRQAEALRKMLLAIVTDPRLVLIRLAVQLHLLRESKDAPAAERERIAFETREIYAPLANRLGVWQLKWELEDLSFRCLDAENYQRVAGWLAAKRIDRERTIEEVTVQLRAELAGVQIEAEVAGRPKHIYSIWRKMQRKGLSFEQLYDIRALRVLVNTIADCYGALGVVHSLWRHIPGEFDDYIATPKDNLYRSLHTAVIGPGKQPLEIQIRTREMHEHAELGVAAHWRYKEGSASGDAAQDRKIAWMRRLLDMHAEGGHAL